MGKLDCTGVYKKFGKVEVLKGVDVSATEGELLVLLGPSGCGKSTLLRIIAGLETLDSGSIIINANDISNTHPRDRNIAMVFQNYALFPLMTVRENLSFGMKINKVPEQQIQQKIAQAVQILGIEDLLERKPAQLSGGQRQRVAMGRAMVRDPQLFLFDEPLSNLDAKLRARMRVEIKELQQQIGVTTVYVTHDQMEAMTMADQLVVMREGYIEQAGTPETVYEKPNSIYTASFLGSPEINLLNGDLVAGKYQAHGLGLPLPTNLNSKSGKITYGIRPHDIDLCPADQDTLSGKVVLLEQTGGFAIVHIRFADGKELAIQAQGGNYPKQGQECHFKIRLDCVHLFDSETGKRIN